MKELIAKNNWAGTIGMGHPAEEGGSGKVYMVRKDCSKTLTLCCIGIRQRKPGGVFGALANTSAKFRFYGIAAHASASPERGRSALDGVESMDYMVNMMREHVPSDSRIHYVITNGGKAPNVVPDFAEVYYYVRNPSREQVKQIFERVTKAADGAAMGTGTRVEYEVIGGTYDLLLNKTLADAMQVN